MGLPPVCSSPATPPFRMHSRTPVSPGCDGVGATGVAGGTTDASGGEDLAVMEMCQEVASPAVAATTHQGCGGPVRSPRPCRPVRRVLRPIPRPGLPDPPARTPWPHPRPVVLHDAFGLAHRLSRHSGESPYPFVANDFPIGVAQPTGCQAPVPSGKAPAAKPIERKQSLAPAAHAAIGGCRPGRMSAAGRRHRVPVRARHRR